MLLLVYMYDLDVLFLIQPLLLLAFCYVVFLLLNEFVTKYFPCFVRPHSSTSLSPSLSIICCSHILFFHYCIPIFPFLQVYFLLDAFSLVRKLKLLLDVQRYWTPNSKVKESSWLKRSRPLWAKQTVACVSSSFNVKLQRE